MACIDVASTIIFEDSEIIVCQKPAGLAVQNARMRTMDMESGLKNYLAAKCPGKIPYLAVVHRLDQPVEGVLVFAKNQQAAKELGRQMAGGEMGKHYLAVTDKCPPSSGGVLEDYLRKDKRTNMSCVVFPETTGAKYARLSYLLLEELPDIHIPDGVKYLLDIHLDTGRHHQIRVQMCHAGMPLLGDRKYYPEDASGLPLGLCSYKLEFLHPKTKQKMCFEIVPRGIAFDGISLLSEERTEKRSLFSGS